MSRRANPTIVGGFILAGLAILVAGVLVLGGGRLFKRTVRFIVFFEGSVNGLAVGSPVKVAGVPVGQVIEIDAIVDADSWIVLTKTVIEIDPARLTQRGLRAGEQDLPYQELVEHGVRARLEMQSLLTGQLYVELSFHPDTEARLVGGDTRYPEIPSLPTTVQEIEAEIRRTLAKIAELPLDEIVKNLNGALAGVDRLVNDPSIPRALANLDAALADAQKAMQGITQLSQRATGEIDPVAKSATATLDDARRSIEEVRAALGARSPLAYQISSTLRELDRTLEAVRLMAQEIERNPSSLVFGRSRDQ
jgi:paraquat-inducible protein B